jgi:peptidoglycan/xylan/chitin deacetylase (PgdA/CDA1 family)
MPLLIINHHYFRKKKPGRGIYPISPNELNHEIKNLQLNGWKLGCEEDILKLGINKSKKDQKIAVITFDDGLREQYLALEQLIKVNISPICYIPTLPYTENKVLPVHKLQMLRSKISDKNLSDDLDNEYNFKKIQFEDKILEIQYRYDSKLSRKIKYFLNFMLDVKEKNNWLSKYFEKTFGNESLVAKKLYFSKDELKFLAAKNQIGSHAHSHVPLSSLNKEGLKKELMLSKNILRDVSGFDPNGISYPYGGKSSVSDMVYDVTAECGYRYGITMERGVNQLDQAKKIYSLKRIDVNDLKDWLI